jgi:hypothetical protein
MAGITDAPFRRLCRRFGAGMTTSEMTTADTSLWQTAKSRFRLDLDLDAEPIAVQIAGSEANQLASAAQACVARGAQIIDINMGCPASFAMKNSSLTFSLRSLTLSRCLSLLNSAPDGTGSTATLSRLGRLRRTPASAPWLFMVELARIATRATPNTRQLRG